MTGTLKKGVLSLLLALAVLVSAFERIDASTAAASISEEAISAETEPEESGEEGTEPEETTAEEPAPEDTTEEEPQEPEGLTAPQNLREEDGFIVWDEVEAAYGYYVHIYNNNADVQTTYYPNCVELKRFFYTYTYDMDFGEYTAEVCAFDESGNVSEYSNAVTVSYAPTFDMPTNVRVSEDGSELLWDEVEGAARYNIRIYNDDEERTLYTWTDTRHNDLWFNGGWFSESGSHWFTVQAMDWDYNVSEWTEPILVSHIAEEHLDAPQNVRLDESGENIIWDAVEGADYYYIYYSSDFDEGGTWAHRGFNVTEPQLSNWKSFTCPRTDGEYGFYVYAYSDDGKSSYNSKILTLTFNPTRDETIEVPETHLEDNYLQLDVEENTNYWLCISATGEVIDSEYSYFDPDQYYDYRIYFNNRLPAGDYEAELYVLDENNNYNCKTYPFTLNTVPDETVWVPELYYKFETLLWDYDRLRHDDTYYFWIRLKKGDTVVKLAKSRSEYFYGLPDLTDGDYSIEACVYEYTDKIGKWSTPLYIKKHGDSLFDKENETTTEVERDPAGENVPEEDRITSITINPAFNMKNKDGDDVELDLSKITIKAKEIYDEEGLQRASEALGETIVGNKHYNLLDLTLLYDGEDFSNGYEGLVQVIIPIPEGHRDKKFSCYRLIEVDGQMVKQEIPGEQTEDSYIIYLEHFSEYALVGSGEEEHTHEYGESYESDESGHWQVCECGEETEKEEHIFGEWEVTEEATETEEGSRERSCEICGYTDEESIPMVPHTHKYGETYESDESGHWQVCECGEKSEKQAHTFGEWKVTKEATEEEEGEETRKCEICEKTETKSIEKLTPSDSSEEPPVSSDSSEEPPVSSDSSEEPPVSSDSSEEPPVSSDNSEEPIVTPSNPSPSIPDGGSSGNFYVPESTGSGTTTTAAPTEAESVTQLADDNTGAGSDTAAAPADTEKADEASTAPAETTQAAETPDETAQTVGGANENGSDKNHNTGVAIAFIPALAAALGVVVFRKRK